MRLASPSAVCSTIKRRTTTLESWTLEKTESAFAPPSVWSNEDCEPASREQWTWTQGTFVAYWCSDLISATSWTAVSSYTSALGLTWWEALLAIFVSGVLLAILITANGIIGARLHTPFAITARSSFGLHLSKPIIVSRAVIAMFWGSIVTYQGGGFVTQMLIAIWPTYANLPNTLPASSGLTSQDFLSFVLFWAIQFPFILIHPTKLRWLFVAKISTIPIVAIGTMAWSIKQAGPEAVVVLTAKATGNYFGFFTAVTASMGVWITLACNISDFSRYSKRESSAVGQLVVIPILWVITALFGSISSTCLVSAYGEDLFQPFQIIAKWQGTSIGRAAAFFCSAAWILASVGTNITANTVSASNDLCTLFPKYINIFRGQVFAVTVGVFGFAPWLVLNSAASFVNFMSAYSVVLAPVAGIMAADFFIIKSGRVDVPALYDPVGIYRFGRWGINWRAGVALIVAIGPAVPGIVTALSPGTDIGGAKYIFMIGDIWGAVVGAFIHVSLSKLFPHLPSLVSVAVRAQDVLDERKLEKTPSITTSISTEEGEEQGETKKEDGVNVEVLAVVV